jgi:hypothetical protein
MYEAAERIRLDRLAAEEVERKRQEEEARREARRERYNKEVELTNELSNAAEDYDLACKIRSYAAAVETSANLSDEQRAWVEWAKRKADWFDPSVARDDEIFGERDHKKDGDFKILKKSYSTWRW